MNKTILLTPEQNSETLQGETSKKGRKAIRIFLTVDCLKKMAMISETKKGEEIRDYFLNIFL